MRESAVLEWFSSRMIYSFWNLERLVNWRIRVIRERNYLYFLSAFLNSDFFQNLNCGSSKWRKVRFLDDRGWFSYYIVFGIWNDW